VHAHADDAMATVEASCWPAEMCVYEIEVIGADVLQQLDDCMPEGYNWSQGHSPPPETALEEYSRQYYLNNNHVVMCTNEGLPTLFNEEKHWPENTDKDDQALIIFQHLLFHYLCRQ
jgi:hypothetical protein